MLKKALVIRFSSLGDIVQTFSSVSVLAKNGFEIHFLTKEKFKDLALLHPAVNTVYSISDHASISELFSKIKELRAQNYDIVFDLHRNLRSLLTVISLGRPFKRVRKYRAKEIFLYLLHKHAFRKLMKITGIKPLDRVNEALRVVSEIFPKQTHFQKPQVLRLCEPGQSIARRLHGITSEGKTYICISAESAWKQKEWPKGRFSQVSAQFRKENIETVWVGLNSPPSKDGIDLTASLQFSELAYVLKHAALLLCNDSGLMHLSEEVGTPVVACFGPTSPELGFAPRHPRSKVVQKDLWCQPCSKSGRWCIRPTGRWKCLSQLEVSQVLNKSREVLSGLQSNKLKLNQISTQDVDL